ncbi:MAG: hypothetical protein ACTSQQ_02285, partial [Candidatus Helarchaeota archaeon]
MSVNTIQQKSLKGKKYLITAVNTEGIPNEFVPREELLRKVSYYEFPHTIVLSKGFQSGFTLHSLLKHVIQDRGYKIKELQHLVNKSISGEEYFISGGFKGIRTIEAKRRKGSGASGSKEKGSTGTARLMEKTTIEFWLSYIGSLHTYKVMKKLRNAAQERFEIHYDGTGMQIKVMIAIDFQKMIAKNHAMDDFEFFKKIIPGLLSVNLLSMDFQFAKEPILRFIAGSMPWLDPPD